MAKVCKCVVGRSEGIGPASCGGGGKAGGPGGVDTYEVA